MDAFQVQTDVADPKELEILEITFFPFSSNNKSNGAISIIRDTPRGQVRFLPVSSNVTS